MTSILDYKRSPSGKSIPEKNSILEYKNPRTTKIDNNVQKPEEEKSLTQRIYEQMQGSENTERDIERNIARGTSRMGERILGFPADIVNFIQGITGKKAGEFPLPTSQELKEKSEKWSQGYTSPQNALEEKSDEFLGDVAGMMIPGGTVANRGLQLARVVGIPLAGALAHEGIKYKTGDEKKATWAKLGTMFILDLLAQRFNASGDRGISSRSYINGLFESAEASVAPGATADATTLQTALMDLRNTMQRGGTSPTTTPALTKIDEALAVINNGQIEVAQLPAFRRNINAIRQSLGGWEAQMPPTLKIQAINNLERVKNSIIEAGENYGRTQNPEFLQYWQSANEASAVIARSNVVSNFVQKYFGNKFVSKGAQALFGVGTVGAAKVGSVFAPAATAGTALLGGLASGMYVAGKAIYRVMNSPTLRRYYIDTITAAANGQKAVMIQNLAKLDKALAEEEEKENQKVRDLVK